MRHGLVMKLLLLAFVLMVSGVDIPAAERSLITATRADLFGGLKSALDQFAVDCGRYPTTSEGLEALMTCPTNLSTAPGMGHILINYGKIYGSMIMVIIVRAYIIRMVLIFIHVALTESARAEAKTLTTLIIGILTHLTAGTMNI